MFILFIQKKITVFAVFGITLIRKSENCSWASSISMQIWQVDRIVLIYYYNYKLIIIATCLPSSRAQ